MVMHIKFPSPVMVMAVASNGRHVMPLRFFPQRLTANTHGYVETFDAVVNPYIEGVARRSLYMILQDSTPSPRTAYVTQAWLAISVHICVAPKMSGFLTLYILIPWRRRWEGVVPAASQYQKIVEDLHRSYYG